MNTSPIVSATWLSRELTNPRLVVLDATIPKVGESGPHRLAETRIPGARYFDLNEKFADPTTDLPHNLPTPAQFTEESRQLGINADSQIVIYDHHGIYVSPRAWWMFRAMGHANVRVLDGGLPAWIDAGYATEPKTAQTIAIGNFEAQLQPDLVWNAQQVLGNVSKPVAIVLDARSGPRFSGEQAEPRPGLKQGHIPQSLNLPFDRVLENGRLKSDQQLQQLFQSMSLGKGPLVFSCGSGITACITMLAAEKVLPNQTAVYDGSWAEWGQPEHDFPIEGGQ